MKKYACILLAPLFLLWAEMPLRAQFQSMWTVRTNAFEWVALIPNFGVEFDLSPSPYNRSTLGLTGKINWNTKHKLSPSIVYDIAEIRPEYRYYQRDKQLRYFGAYANYTKYAFLLGKTGYQGTAAGLGASFGYVFNLYKFKSGALDLELGASAGLQATDYQAFTHHRDGSYYSEIPSKSRAWHVTPFPVVSELRAALCWRHTSATEKYIEVDPRQVHFTQDSKAALMDVATWNTESFANLHQGEDFPDDYTYRSEFIKYVDGEYETAYNTRILSDENDTRLSPSHKRKLAAILKKGRTKAIADFDKELRKAGRKVIKKQK